jgi:hypothetical protein
LPREIQQLLRDELQEFRIGDFLPEPGIRLVLAPENIIPDQFAFPDRVTGKEVLIDDRGATLGVFIKRLPELLDQFVQEEV